MSVDKTRLLPLAQLFTAGGGKPSLRATLTNTQNYTVPGGVNAIYVGVIGAGGGGAGGNTSAGTRGGGGGAGGFFTGAIPVFGNQVLSMVVGAGGSAGNGGMPGNAGGTGGASYVAISNLLYVGYGGNGGNTNANTNGNTGGQGLASNTIGFAATTTTNFNAASNTGMHLLIVASVPPVPFGFFLSFMYDLVFLYQSGTKFDDACGNSNSL